MRSGDLAHREPVVALARENVAGGVENLLPQQGLLPHAPFLDTHGQQSRHC